MLVHRPAAALADVLLALRAHLHFPIWVLSDFLEALGYVGAAAHPDVVLAADAEHSSPSRPHWRLRTSQAPENQADSQPRSQSPQDKSHTLPLQPTGICWGRSTGCTLQSSQVGRLIPWAAGGSPKSSKRIRRLTGRSSHPVATVSEEPLGGRPAGHSPNRVPIGRRSARPNGRPSVRRPGLFAPGSFSPRFPQGIA